MSVFKEGEDEQQAEEDRQVAENETESLKRRPSIETIVAALCKFQLWNGGHWTRLHGKMEGSEFQRMIDMLQAAAKGCP